MTEQAVAVATPDSLPPTPQTDKLMTPVPSVTPSTASRFLQLPPELRVLIYPFLSPYSSTDREHFGKAQHLNLIQTCRQIREEAPLEIEKAAENFYRNYEKTWDESHGEQIRIKKYGSWDSMSVHIGDTFNGRGIPLLDLPLKRVDICVTQTETYKPKNDLLRRYYARLKNFTKKADAPMLGLTLNGSRCIEFRFL
ncbi:hypothetical protein J4E93_002905 [Alternaria ventricosa]|uniref:uncharacterized protein n=1 Tax=Alternaria ventricosa TaxID=1187951 RepID=UPI0020C4BA20|nr:uncharacterized protein J4E93_002905 [Alternaria ventricosa]KAI4650549.1 hypothetical protein J4E93_002905 [Alternaria ventricosa]